MFPQTHPHRAAREVSRYRFPPFLPSVRHYSRLYCNKLKGKQHSKKGSVCSGSRSRNPSRPDSLYKLFFPPNAAHVLSLSFFLSFPLSPSAAQLMRVQKERKPANCENLFPALADLLNTSLCSVSGDCGKTCDISEGGYFPNQRLSVSKCVNAAIGLL